MMEQTGAKNEPVIKLMNVSKQISGKTIIDGLTLEIQRGEVFGLLGPNGAGKTTTIRMMVGLISITAGDILIHGASIIKDFRRAIAHVGAIVENPELYEFLTGYQNLVHYANLYPEVTPERIQEVISFIGLENRIHDRVKTYSLGMRQRLGVAQAILNKPSILILDEPTNGLDPAGIKELRDYLRFLAQNEGVSVIVSSHLLSEMELLCDRAAIIKNGRLLGVHKVGDPSLGEKETIIFEVNQPDTAQAEIREHFSGIRITGALNGIEVESDRETTAAITACLVQAGIKVYRVRPQALTLENIFMEVTADDGITKNNPQ
jgi:ABC-2 type transport system ATP-binding protein